MSEYKTYGDSTLEYGSALVRYDGLVRSYLDVIVEHRDTNGTLKDRLEKIAEGLEFDYNRIGGCGYLELKIKRDFTSAKAFAADDDIRVLVKSELDMTWKTWWRGYVESRTRTMADAESWTIRAVGYVGQLGKLVVTRTYSGWAVEDIVRDVLDEYVVGISGVDVTYDATDIEATGLIVKEIEFDDTVVNVMRKLADLVGKREWGVGPDAKFFFKERTNDLAFTLFAGSELEDYEPIDDWEAIVNRIYIRGGRKADGTIYRYTADNSESQTDFGFGVKARLFNNSSIQNDTDANRYAQAIMQDTSNLARRTRARLKASRVFFHESTPIGFVQVPNVNVGLDRPIYGTFLYGTQRYGGVDTYQLSNVRYALSAGGSGFDVQIDLGQDRPELFVPLSRLEFDLANVAVR